MPLEQMPAEQERTPSPVAKAVVVPVPSKVQIQTVTIPGLSLQQLPKQEQELHNNETILKQEAIKKCVQEVAEFMRREGFEMSAEKVSKDELDGELVFECLLSSDNELKEDLALQRAIDRLRFRVLFMRWLSAGSVSKLGTFSPENVSSLFQSYPRLVQFSEVSQCYSLYQYELTVWLKVIIQEKIDGEMLNEADAPALEDLGISGINCTIVKRVIREMGEEEATSSP